MTKFNLRLKSFSVSNPTTPIPSPSSYPTDVGEVVANIIVDPPSETELEPTKPTSKTKAPRTPSKYLVSLRRNRFFTLRSLRKRRNSEGHDEGHQVDKIRIPTPKSLPGTGRTPASTPKTPQLASLFSSSARSESHRHHHRQYAVSLSSFPQIRNMMMMDRSQTNDPESPSVSRLRRMNSRKQRVTSAPVNLGTIVPTRYEGPVVGGGGIGGGVILLERGMISSVSNNSIMPIPSLILQAPTSASGSGGESRSSRNTDSSSGSSGTASKDTPDQPPIPILHAEKLSSHARQTTAFHRTLTILQEAAKRMRAEGEYNQWSLFWFLILPTIVLASLATFTITPNTIWDTSDSKLSFFGITMRNSISVPCIVVVMVAASLRWMLYILASLFHSFCEMDVDTFFAEKKNGIVDESGRRVAQVDIVSGIFG